MYLYKKKKIFLLVMLVTLLTGCGGGSSSTSTGATVSTTTPTQEAAPATTTAPVSKAVHSGQVKDSSTGNGLANVTVSLGESTTITDKDGFYTLSDLSASEEAVINFEKEGYLLGSTQIQIKSLLGDNTTSSNYLEYDMYTHDYQWNHESTKEISSPRIDIDASVAYTDTEGNPYSGTMEVELTILDNNEEALLSTFPGAFKGMNTNGTLVQFDTYGMISISLKDSNGNKLSFSDGETGALIFKSISSLEKPNTLPLWYFDYDQGLWVEEGYAELQEDGSYKGEISHLGTWSLNKPLEEDPGIYLGRIIDENGVPIGNVRVYAVGENWVSSDLTTDENGIFELKVIPGDSFELTAYDYQNKYGASYNGTIAAITSGDVVEN